MTNQVEAGHIEGMSIETVSKPASGERPLPTTPTGIHEAAAEVRALRGSGLTWAEVSVKTGFTRASALRLTHNLFELTDAAHPRVA